MSRQKSILAKSKALSEVKRQDAINTLVVNFNTWATNNNISAFLTPTQGDLKGQVNRSARGEVIHYLIAQLVFALAKNIVYEDILRGIEEERSPVYEDTNS